MRISDWSSDVCSSDLLTPPASGRGSYLLHPALGAFSSRASGMISRIRAQKCLRHTSLSLSGPLLKLFDCMPCWTRVMSAVSRSEEHTSGLQSLMRISYAVFCFNNNNYTIILASTHSQIGPHP